MFYYTEIDSNYKVINTHSLSEVSTNPNYIPITEELYNNGNDNGELVGQYYNTLLDIYETIDMNWEIGRSNWVNHKGIGMPLSTKIDNMDVIIANKADIDHTHEDYATADHVHSGYASSDDLALLEDVIDTKSNATHTHTEYAGVNHSHNGYVTTVDFDTLSEEVDGKADSVHSHSEYALSSHEHDNYASSTHTHTASEIGAATSGHNHDSDYADISHNHDSAYAASGHDHDEDYSPASHSHTNYATTTALNELSTTVSGKANASHSHNDTYYTETEIDAKLADKADSNHNHAGVYDVSGAAASALTSANTYTDNEIDALSEIVATKANNSDLTSHAGNATIHITSTERNSWNAAKTHANSAHAPANAEPNQNAFSNVVVGDTTIFADEKTDTITFVAGNNVTITPDSTGDSITISSANTVYSHPTSAGNKHIPAGGSSGQILRWSADGTAVWGADNNTTYSNATQSASGLMSNTDKAKLDGVAENANNYTLPSAGTNLGGVKTGGDVTISSGVITVNDDSHNHIISNIDGLQSALDGKASSGHNHDDAYYTETEVNTMLSGKANASHTHTIANITNLQSTLDGKAAASHGTHVSYSTTAPVMDGTASVGAATTVARSDHKHPVDTSRAAKTSLDSHTSNKSNPHGVTLAQLGVTATAAELNALDGITATATELNYMYGVTSNVQTQLNGKAASSHGTHVTYGTTAPKANGTAAVGTASSVSRSDHIHPLQTTVSGNAGTATKLATARTISLTGDVSGSTSFDGSGNVSITATVADDSHNHTIANVDGLQSALNDKAPIFTNTTGGVEYSYGSNSGKNVLTEISNMPQGFHTIYAIGGTSGNPETAESYRFFIHKTSTTIGWIYAFGADGSIYSNYLAGANTYKGWKTIHDAKRKPLWTGSYYMTAGHTATPSKKLSQCEHGWMLLWSDYDPDTSTVNNTDFCTTMIPNRNWVGGTWNGAAYYCDIPRYTAGTATDSESRVIKVLNVYDNKLVGTANNNAAPRNDVILRAVYEF